MKKLIALDLDGTLLNSAGITTEYTKKILKSANDAGYYIVPVTGRSISHVPKWLLETDFIEYIITANGARCISTRTDLRSLNDMMKKEQMLRVLSIGSLIGEKLFVSWNLHIDGKVYREDNFGEPRPMNPRLVLPMDMYDYVEQFGDKTEIEKMDAYFKDAEQKNRVLKAVKSFDDMYISSANENNIEFNNKTANKGNALKKLAKLLDVYLKNSMAFGDGLNDLTMLNAVVISVAMGNSAVELKNKAKYIAKSCDEDGVAIFINDYLKRKA